MLECAAIQDVLVVGKVLEEDESQNRKTELDRMAAMLNGLGGRGYQVREGTVTYGQCEAEVDPDPDEEKPRRLRDIHEQSSVKRQAGIFCGMAQTSIRHRPKDAPYDLFESAPIRRAVC